MNRPPMPFGIGTYHVIARSRQATWQSVTPAAQRAARPQRGRRDADCHGPDGPRNDRGGRWLVPFRRTCSGHRWRVLRNGHNRSLHWVSLFVGAIHESPADAEWHRNIPRHCEEPQGDVAIPWYKGRPENRRDCHAAFAARNDVITGRAILESPLWVLFDTRKSPSKRTGIFYAVGNGYDRSAVRIRITTAPPAQRDRPPSTSVIARSEATWQSVTPAAQRAARSRKDRRDADCHGR